MSDRVTGSAEDVESSPSPGPGRPDSPGTAERPTGAERGRRTFVAIAALAVVAALLVCCAGAVGAVFFARSAMEGALDSFTTASESVQWSGDGRFAIIQSYTGEGRPQVVAWDARTGEVRTESGFYALVVERSGAVIWLVPEDDPAAPHDGWLDPLGDTPPRTLQVWDLSESGSRPVDPDVSLWEPWPGPGGITAHAEVFSERGAFPSAIGFSSTGVETVESEARLPRSFGTFDPVGWSAEGGYVALVERVGPEARARVVIVDANDGETVAVAETPVTFRPGSVAATWDPHRDLLFVGTSETGESGRDGTPAPATTVTALSPDGSQAPASSALGYELPPELTRADELAILGSGSEGVVLVADDMLWFLGTEEAEGAGTLPMSYSTAYHPQGGILTLAEEWSDRDATIRTVVSLSDTRGRSPRVVWEGPERSITIGAWGE